MSTGPQPVDLVSVELDFIWILKKVLVQAHENYFFEIREEIK